MEGINIKYETRKDRAGYKAGNLREGMKHGYVQACEFVAMFDADFQPAPDFLVKTVPFLVHNRRLALVQTRWNFGEFLSFFFFCGGNQSLVTFSHTGSRQAFSLPLLNPF
jgi:cellulose synthase/poly-beta-1,6-N-acetylglucosamine synthase-like glycosyltransferase